MRVSAALAILASLLLALLSPAEARAFPFMIRHGYTGCGECHIDPSGSGVLTAYGRGQSEILLSTVWGEPHEPGKGVDFLFGWVPLPEPLALQADFRGLLIPEPGNFRAIAMQNDLRGALSIGPVVAYASAGFVSQGAAKARFFPETDDPAGTAGAVSREYWVGVKPVDTLMVRAGRINTPYGIRTDNHIVFARSATQTTINDDQPFGLDAYWSPQKMHAEVLLGAGNPQVHSALGSGSSDWRELSYHATVGWTPESNIDIGVSSLMGKTELDLELREPRVRMADSLHVRWAPVKPIVLFAEAGVLVDRFEDRPDPQNVGSYGWLLADYEPVQGVHLEGSGEWCTDGSNDFPPVGRGSGAVRWFAAPHVDVRVDAMYGTLNCTPGEEATFMGLLQGHVYL